MYRKQKICFIALNAYPLLARRKAGNIIGPDVHQVILARGLLEHKLNISFVTYYV